MRNDHIELAIAYIKDHLDRTLTRSELATVAGINPDHFTRMFKKYTGHSPTSYIARLRMEKAKEMLAGTPSSVMDVARKVGYEDPYHFSRRFKQFVGVSPTGYMDSPEIRVAALDGYGHCLALGVVPVTADFAVIGDCLGMQPDLCEDLHLAPERTVNLERLAELKPDVILAMNRGNEGELAEIAPVLSMNVLDDPINVQLRQVAERLGRTKEAEDWIGEYEARRQALSAELPPGRRSVAVLRIREQLIQVYGMQNMGYPFYRALQLAPPERILLQTLCNAHFHSSAISMEELMFYEADFLFVVTQPEEGARRRWEELRSSPQFRSHPAVLSGRVHHLDVGRWLAYDPLSIRHQMEEAAVLLRMNEEAPDLSIPRA